MTRLQFWWIAAIGATCLSPLLAADNFPFPPSGSDGYVNVSFEKLAGFDYVMPEDNGTTAVPPRKGQIPKEILALNNSRVALKGFMLPLTTEGGLVTDLLIMRDQSTCCYGVVPKINQWVSVHMAGKGVKPLMDHVITLYGTLKVGEDLENGFLVGIYELEGDKMTGPNE
jgi:hypothetical protein